MGVPVLTYHPQLGELSTSGGSSFARPSECPSHEATCCLAGTPKGSGTSSVLLIKIFGRSRLGFDPSPPAGAASGASSAVTLLSIAEPLASEDQEECLSQSEPVLSVS